MAVRASFDYDQTALSLNFMPHDFSPRPKISSFDASTFAGAADNSLNHCEYCNPRCPEIPFGSVLDQITGSDPSVTDYIFEQPAKCPRCRREILEKTLVEPL